MSSSPQPIINTILADINGIIPNFSSLVASYRLLVGAAEEIRRTPNVCPEVFDRAVLRLDRTGTIIDILLELLCCKISFSSDFLSVTCAPVDIFRLLSNCTEGADTPHHTAEQILQLELLRRALEKARGGSGSCWQTPEPVTCPPPPKPDPPPAAPAKEDPASGLVPPPEGKVSPSPGGLENEAYFDLETEKYWENESITDLETEAYYEFAPDIPEDLDY